VRVAVVVGGGGKRVLVRDASAIATTTAPDSGRITMVKDGCTTTETAGDDPCAR
jgi:hypothetical protein